MSNGDMVHCENCGRKIRPGEVLCSDCKHLEETEDDRIKESNEK